MNKGNGSNWLALRAQSAFFRRTLLVTDQFWRNRSVRLPGLISVVLAIAIMTFFNSILAQAQSDEESAIKQALAWLATIDDADYPSSFASMAGDFTIGVREEIWQQRISQLRETLGPVKSRLLQSAEAASNIQGAPAGDYYIVEFRTVFESDPSITEAVTMYKQDDGNWKSAGYYAHKSK